MTAQEIELAIKMRKENRTLKYIADKLHYSDVTIWNNTKDSVPSKSRWTEEQMVLLMVLRKQGWTFTNISTVAGHSKDACKIKYNRINK